MREKWKDLDNVRRQQAGGCGPFIIVTDFDRPQAGFEAADWQAFIQRQQRAIRRPPN